MSSSLYCSKITFSRNENGANEINQLPDKNKKISSYNHRDEDISECEESFPTATVGQWFGDLTASLAKTLKDGIPQTKYAIDDLAGVIKRSANAIATELVSLEMEAGREARKWAENMFDSEDDDDASEEIFLPLPWHIQEETHVYDCKDSHESKSESSLYNCEIVEDKQLKSEIFELSKKDSTFTEPYNNDDKEKIHDKEFPFDLEAHANLINRLLELDLNLRKVHARLSIRRVNEYIFWKNYFFHCATLKEGRDVIKIVEYKKGEKNPSKSDIVDAKLESEFVKVQSSLSEEMNQSKNPSDDIYGNKTNCQNKVPHTLSMGDLVLVSGGDEDLNEIAARVPS